jgi:hypothetical protein
MDEHHQRIECFDRFEQRDRRGGIDGLNIDHPGLPALEIDRAVNIDALAPARLFDRRLVLLGRPAADRPRRMGRMEAKFLRDEGRRLAASSAAAWWRQRLSRPLLARHSKSQNALLKQLVPAADRVVVQQKRCRYFFTVPPVVRQH